MIPESRHKQFQLPVLGQLIPHAADAYIGGAGNLVMGASL